MSETIAAVPDVVATLLKLEPLLSNAVVFNLAYLALPKFAYIDEIRRMVGERLARFDPSDLQTWRDAEWFKQARALTQVRTIERIEDTDQPRWLNLPDWWGVVYNLLLYWRVGRSISIALTAVSLLMLIVAVGDENGAISWLPNHFPQTTVHLDFWITMAALLWPILVVTLGNWVMRSAVRFVTYQTKGLKTQAAAGDQQAVDTFDVWFRTLPPRS